MLAHGTRYAFHPVVTAAATTATDASDAGLPSRPGWAERRPGRVVALRGIIFQSDARSDVGAWFIRPFEALDEWVAGLRPNRGGPPLAIHAGLHVALDDGREFVVEQLVGGAYKDLQDGLCWAPLARFRARDRGGWDVTVPATAFRGVTDEIVRETIQRLNRIDGAPFFAEDCTALIERAFGTRQLFADSPTLRALGIRGRLGDPAMPLLRADAALDERVRTLLRTDVLAALPGPGHASEPRAASVWGVRIVVTVAALVCAAILLAAARRLRAGGSPVP
jgi:hypothetical protein